MNSKQWMAIESNVCKSKRETDLNLHYLFQTIENDVHKLKRSVFELAFFSIQKVGQNTEKGADDQNFWDLSGWECSIKFFTSRVHSRVSGFVLLNTSTEQQLSYLRTT